MSGFINLTGKKFGRWTVIERTSQKIVSQEVRWLCLCECGTVRIVGGSILRKGKSLSCGCYKRECMSLQFRKHGDITTSEYRTWDNIKSRCTLPSTRKYAHYGGRGIKVCERWSNSYEHFLEDMGRKPGPKYSIDRIDNNGDYEKSNCKWSTIKEQSRNKRNTRFVEYHGVTRRLIDVADELGLYGQLVYGWVKKGKNIDEALLNYRSRGTVNNV